jgi:SAM-dependent methyltransferase
MAMSDLLGPAAAVNPRRRCQRTSTAPAQARSERRRYARRMKRHAPAAERNREPILAALAPLLPAQGVVLEIASGSGQHAVWFATALPQLTWQPSDPDAAARRSISAWASEAALPNLRPPLELDAAADAWPIDRCDAIVCINMVHISPWASALGLFAGAARCLPAGGLLFLYGPYRFSGAFTAPSNEAFDRSLREQDPAWGVRDVDDLETAAGARGFTLEDVVAMPANNHALVFRRGAT